MADLLINFSFQVVVAVVGGVLVSLFEYFFIPSKKENGSESQTQSQRKSITFSWNTVIGGIIGAVVFPVIFAVFPSWKQAILNGFDFLVSDPSEGSALIAFLGVVFGCLIGAIYKNALEALVYAVLLGGTFALSVWVYGGVILAIFHFGEWSYISSILSDWSIWGFWIGMFFGSIKGAQAKGKLLNALKDD